MAAANERDAKHTALGPGREFDLVRRLTKQWKARAQGIGDDAAVLAIPKGSRLVASVDTSVEGVHFRRTWLEPREIGYRAAASALSDLAAMAAEPLGLLVAITLPDEVVDDAVRVADGIGEAGQAAGCPIVGGDTTRGVHLVLTLAVIGHSSAPVRRSGARPRDRIYVTGRLGGPGAALAALWNGRAPHPVHRERLARPVPRIAEARWLAEHGASAMIDISDGLASELRHLAAASGVAMTVELERVPLVQDVTAADAGVSGEEYELLLTAPKDLDSAAFRHAFGLPLTMIGRVHAGDPTVVFSLRGARVDLQQGYDHFSP